MPVTITAKVSGFRRCGIAHPDTATTYPDDRFTKVQLDELRAEPMLVVSLGAEPVSGADIAAEEQIAALKAEVRSLNAAAESLSHENGSLTGMVENLNRRIEHLTAENEAFQAELTALREQKNTLSGQEEAPPAPGDGDKKTSAKK
ncbi:HI1506-related protein [Morganella psychrotolerans]|uniref:Mu-like prophage FluMu N-terminal domain-containing protein n=1 Tax=Morganella psychrotolerans TaxID=368603 RepID=A0A1B8HRM1_9GAMM|nr:HI1506-related protein [Morganella psychrotolerans]OBU12170.1 hypothetical protein AYY18_16730 [Morganella psychrotolerans]